MAFLSGTNGIQGFVNFTQNSAVFFLFFIPFSCFSFLTFLCTLISYILPFCDLANIFISLILQSKYGGAIYANQTGAITCESFYFDESKSINYFLKKKK